MGISVARTGIFGAGLEDVAKGLSAAAVGLALLFASGRADALVYTYENTTPGTISNAATPCANPLVRGFVVSDSFTVNRVAVGLNITHTNRGDVRATLVAPGGATLQLIAGSGDGDDNYDILVSSNSEGAIDDNDADPIAQPYYNRIVTGPATIDSFYTGNAVGTWSLQVCDTAAATDGTFNRAYLMLASGAAATGTSTGLHTYDWGTNGAVVAFSSATLGEVTMSQGATADHGGTGTNTPGSLTPPAIVTRTTTNGNHLGYYFLSMEATSLGGTQDNEAVGLQSTINFTPSVRDLQFSLLDVDITGSAWEDQVQVIGLGPSGNRVPYTLTPGGAAVQLAGDISEGDASAGVTATTGNVAVVFSESVASLTINYGQGSDPANENVFMVVGLSDFSFAAYDFGDAPASYGVSLATNGPKHVLRNREIWLGANRPDGEADGQPVAAGAAATLDNTTAIGGVNDEDGVAAFPLCPHTGSYTVSVSASDVRAAGSNGYLVGYIDWNRDGDFADAGERSATMTVPRTNTDPTSYDLTWSGVPANCGGTTATYARFRYTSTQARAESPTDGTGVSAPDGEVEDYQISAGTLPVTIARVESEVDGDALAVRWTTATEWANAAFRVIAMGDHGVPEVLAEVPAVTPDSMTPQKYETVVPVRGVKEFTLQDVSLFGETRSHGPFKVGETAGLEPEGMRIDWAAVRAEAGMGPVPSKAAVHVEPMAVRAAVVEARLQVKEEGIHRVTHEELLAAGVDLRGARPDQIALLDEGEGVARYVFTNGAREFGPGAYVEFVGRPDGTTVDGSNVYVLTTRKKGAVDTEVMLPSSGGLGLTTTEDRYTPDRVYSASSPSGDPWYDQGLLALGRPASLKREFDLMSRARGPVQLTVRAWGYGDWPGSEPPDHHIVVLLNGKPIADDRFDGLTAWERSLDVTDVVQSGSNVLEVQVPGNTGFGYDYVAFEGFTVRFNRETVARGGRFEGVVEGESGYSIWGFDTGKLIPIWHESGGKWARGMQEPVSNRVTVPSGGRVYAAEERVLLKPGIVAGVPEGVRTADEEYLVVTHPAFAGSLDGLVALQATRGLSTRIVTVDEIYAAYSDHAPSVDAIREFLTTSWERGKLKYVLLVGADTTDPRDHLGLGSVSFVPTAYLPFVQYVAFSPTDEALVDADGDGLGEVPIGRLPVRSVSELRDVVAKLRAWEANVTSGLRSALLVAGVSDADGVLASINRVYGNSLDTWKTTVVSADERVTADVRNAVLAALNDGTPLVSFVGHSSMGQWDFKSILKWQDVGMLTNTGRPNLVVQWGCWNSYYVEPNVESLSARLLRASGVGAAATIGATTLTSDASHQALGTLFFAQVNGAGGARTVGDAFHNAKKQLLVSGTARDAILGMALLGDPAMTLP